MADLIKSFLVPGSISFLVLGLVVGLVFLYGTERMKRWGRGWLTLLVAAYAFLATPLGSEWVSAPLVRRFTPIMAADQARGIDTIVVLSTGAEVYRAYGQEVADMGKSTALNALETARLFRLVAPRAIIASGGIVDPERQKITEADILAAGLVRLGVPRDRLVVEGRSRTTREQALFSAELLRARRVKRFLLVTSPDHMPRASATFRELGLDPLPSVSSFAVPQSRRLSDRLRPSVNALRQSDLACYEYLARVYYWQQGWFGGKAAVEQ